MAMVTRARRPAGARPRGFARGELPEVLAGGRRRCFPRKRPRRAASGLSSPSSCVHAVLTAIPRIADDLVVGRHGCPARLTWVNRTTRSRVQHALVASSWVLAWVPGTTRRLAWVVPSMATSSVQHARRVLDEARTPTHSKKPLFYIGPHICTIGIAIGHRSINHRVP